MRRPSVRPSGAISGLFGRGLTVYRFVFALASGGVRVVGLRGLEPLTSSLSGKRSNRLSYRPA